MNQIWNDNEDVRSLKSLILFGLRGMAAYAYHARVLGYTDSGVDMYFIEAFAPSKKITVWKPYCHM